MWTLRDLYCLIPLAERTPMWPFPTLAHIRPLRYLPFPSCWPLWPCGRLETYTFRFPRASGLQWDPPRLWRTSAHWDISPFHPADPYSDADASKPIPCDSPRPADSNQPCPDDVRPLAVELSKHLYMCSPGKYFQIVDYWVLQSCRSCETYTIRFPMASGLQWALSRLCRTSVP